MDAFHWIGRRDEQDSGLRRLGKTHNPVCAAPMDEDGLILMLHADGDLEHSGNIGKNKETEVGGEGGHT